MIFAVSDVSLVGNYGKIAYGLFQIFPNNSAKPIDLVKCGGFVKITNHENMIFNLEREAVKLCVEMYQKDFDPDFYVTDHKNLIYSKNLKKFFYKRGVNFRKLKWISRDSPIIKYVDNISKIKDINRHLDFFYHKMKFLNFFKLEENGFIHYISFYEKTNKIVGEFYLPGIYFKNNMFESIISSNVIRPKIVLPNKFDINDENFISISKISNDVIKLIPRNFLECYK